MLKFSNSEVEKKYSSDKDSNPIVHLPGGRNAKGWKGKLADIPLAHAERWINQPNQNLIAIKEVAAEVKPKKDKDPA